MLEVETIENLCMLFGAEMIGDSVLFVQIFPGRKQAAGEEKRFLLLMPFFAAMAGIAAAGAVCKVPDLVNILFDLLCEWNPLHRQFWEKFRQSLIEICEMQIFSKFTYVSVFALIYSKLRKAAVCVSRKVGVLILNDNHEFMGIYVHDAFGTKYVLSEKWEVIYHWICTLISIDFLALGIVHCLKPDTLKSILNIELLDMFPLVILVILMEAANYLSADRRKLWQWLKRNRDGQAADCSMNIIKLESAIEKCASGRGISILKRRRTHQYNFQDKIKEYMEGWRSEEDASVQYLLNYVERETAKRSIPLHSIDSAIRLVKGENLFVANSFYKDLDVCIFFPAFLALLRDEKVLVMLEDNGNLHEVVEWLRQGIENIQDLTDFWTMEELRAIADSVDVGVLAFQNICKEEQLNWCKEYLDRVSFVVVLQASNLLAGGQDIIMSLASRIGRCVERCTWLLTDRNAESMIDLYSHLLDKEFLYVSATPYYARESLITYWNTENENGKAWADAERYVGVEAAIAEIAGRENIGKLHWYGEDMMPIRDLHWVWGQYYEGYRECTGSDMPYQMLIDENILMEVSGSGNSVRRQQFIVTEDEYFNLFEESRQYATRGIDKVCVCILSPDYILRDYMKAQYRLMEADPKFIPQFVPEHVDSRRNIALRILRRLLEEPVSYTELRNTLARDEGYPSDMEVTKEILLRNVQLILPDVKNDDFDINVTHEPCFSEYSMQIEREDYYQIIDEEIKRKFQMHFNQAFYIDETGNARYISKMILGDHLDQKYAKGQFVVFDGKYYEIIGKTSYNGRKALRVKRASDQIYGRKYYRMLRSYIIKDINSGTQNGKNSFEVFHNLFYTITRHTVNLTAETIGYIETDHWSKICGDRRVDLKDDSNGQSDKEGREYGEKQILIVTLENGVPKAMLYLAALLKEMFCTLYPQYYHLLDVAVEYQKYEEEMNDEIKNVISDVCSTMHKDNDSKCCFYVLEDSREDMGLLRSIERNIQKILDIQKRYMTWSMQNGRNYFNFDENEDWTK